MRYYLFVCVNEHYISFVVVYIRPTKTRQSRGKWLASFPFINTNHHEYPKKQREKIKRRGEKKSNFLDVSFENSIVLVHNLLVNGLVEYVHFCGSKVPRADALLEEHVDFSKSSATRLGEPEVGIDDAAEADSAPKESGVVAPVPSSGVQHVWRQNVCDYAHDVAAREVSKLVSRRFLIDRYQDLLEIAGKDNSLNLQTTR